MAGAAAPAAKKPKDVDVWYKIHGDPIDCTVGGRKYRIKPVGKPRAKGFEAPAALFPSDSPWLQYRMHVTHDKGGALAECVLLEVQPLPVPASNGPAGVGKVRKKPSTKQHAKRLADVTEKQRKAAAPALVGDPNFYAMLMYYDASFAMRLAPTVWYKVARAISVDPVGASIWEVLRANMDERVPVRRDLFARAHDSMLLRVYKVLRYLYMECGMTTFDDIGDAAESIAALCGYKVLDAHGPEGPWSFAETRRAEEALLAVCDPRKVGCVASSQWLGDFYAAALAGTDEQAPMLVAPDPQTMADALACGVPEERIVEYGVAARNTLGTDRFAVLRADRLDFVQLGTLARRAQSLVLLGDPTERLALDDRFLHGFAMLCARMGKKDVPFPPGSWQAPVYDQILEGTHETISLLQWARLGSVIPAAKFKDGLVFCDSSDGGAVREAAMRHLSAPGAPVADRLRQGMLFRDTMTSAVGIAHKGRNGVFTLHGKRAKNGRVRRADVEEFTRYMGTRRAHVFCLVTSDTPRTAIAAALKYADVSFTIILCPGSAGPLSSLPMDYAQPRSLRIH